MDSSRGITDEEFKEILSSLSEWYDRHGYINKLKVLYKDLVTDPDKLCPVTKVMDLFKLLRTSGHLSCTDLTILVDTINVTQPFGLEPEIRRLTMTKLLPVRTVTISKFTRNREILIKFVNSLSNNDVKELSKLYNCPQNADRWELFVYLEQKNIFCENNMDDFIRNITSQIIDTQTDSQGLPFTERAASQRASNIADKGQLTVNKDTDAAKGIGRAKYSDNVCTVENNTVIKGNPGFITGSPFNQCNIGTVNVNTTVFPATQYNDAQQVISPSSRQYQEQLRVIKEQLTARQKKVYQDVNRMTPATWNKKYDIDINQVFTNLILLKSKRENKEKQSRGTATHTPEPTTLTEVLSIMKSTDSCKTLITGKGGMGKTTLLRYIAYNWATDVDKTFDGKILFLINIRDIKENTNFLDVIMKQIDYAKEIILKNNLPSDSVEKFLAIHADEIVILLDGYDELEKDAKDPINLFKGLELGKSNVLLTSRPENIDDLVKNCNVQIEVNGFSLRNIREYIHRYFASVNKIELGKLLNQQLMLIPNEHAYCAGGSRNVTLELCSSPLLLLKVCTIWEQKQSIPEDMSDLFKELFCCILNQYKNRAGNKIAVSQFNRIPKEYKCAILALGKCMYKGLQKNVLLIDKYELAKTLGNDEDLVDLALKPGFVYRNNPVSPDDLNEIYTTPHKLLSEALAGFYLAEQIGSLKVNEYDMIRSNKYLHMTKVFAIGFLGNDAGKLLKHWLIISASNYYSLAQYFRHVKKEHKEHVLRVLDKHMSTEMKKQSEQMCDSFEIVLREPYDERATVSKATRLIRLMSQCCVKYENHPEKLEVDMLSLIKKSTEISNICSMLVHILHILQGLCANINYSCKKVFKFLGNWKEAEIETLSSTMENLKFKYTWNKFDVYSKMNPKCIIHFLKNASELTYLGFHPGSVTGVVLNQVSNELHKSQIFLKLRKLDLSKNDLCGGVSLVSLFTTAPKLRVLTMSDCNLTGTILNEMAIECQNYQVLLNLTRLDISRNVLRDLNEVFFNNFLRIFPKLEFLDISYCYITTRFGFNLFNVCDNISAVLNKLNLTGNDLSDVNGVSLAKLIRVSYNFSIDWSNYCLTAINLQDLVSSLGVNGRLIWTMLDLSGINLASVNGRTFACLIKISPQLNHLNMSYCNLSGSSMTNLLNECDKADVVLNDHMLNLEGNDLSDIDGLLLFKLVRVIRSSYDNYFRWSDYCLSSYNLQCLVYACYNVNGRVVWKKLDISGTNLATVNEKTIACLFKICPQLNNLDMVKCNLTGSILRNVLHECDKIGVRLKDIILNLEDNDLSDIDGVSLYKLADLGITYVHLMEYNFDEVFKTGKSFTWINYCLSSVNLQELVNSVGLGGRLTCNNLDLSGINLASVNASTLACLIKIFPQLSHLDMSNCNLSGSTISDVFNECDKIGVVLKANMLKLKGNVFSDIDGVSLAKLVTMIAECGYNYSTEWEITRIDSSNKAFIWNDYCLSAVNLQDLVYSCGANGRLTWTLLDLSGVNLASVSGRTLAFLIKISPQLNHLDMTNCNLSGSSINDLLDESDKNGVVIKDNILSLMGNDLSDIKGVSLAKLIGMVSPCGYKHSTENIFTCSDYCLSAANLQDLVNSIGVDGRLTWIALDLSGINLASVNGKTIARLIKVSPQLSRLDMSNCNLSGSSIKDVLNECCKIDVVLKNIQIGLKGNHLPDIDGVSLSKLVGMITECDYKHLTNEQFRWSDYSLSAVNLQDLVNSVGVDGRLIWTDLDLSGINLAPINERTLAGLIKISPRLSHLHMSKCNLTGSTIRDVLSECVKIGVILKDNMLNLEGNDLSDIDGISLAKLVRINFRYDGVISNKLFKFTDYCLSAVNLQDLVNSIGVGGRLTWTNLDLSGINLASVNASTLARLIKISPQLSHLDMGTCNLSGSSVRDVLNECDEIGVVLKAKKLRLKDNDLSDIDGVSVANLLRIIFEDDYKFLTDILLTWSDYCLSAVNLHDFVNSFGVGVRMTWTTLDLSGINLASFNGRILARLITICPRLKYLDMTNCNLSGTSLRDVLNECDKIGLVLKDNMLRLKGNDLSDIDGASLAKLVKIIVGCGYKYSSKWGVRRRLGYSENIFIWNDYCLSSGNLQDLLISCGEDGRLTWINLNLSGVNLASVNGRAVAGLIKISPDLSLIDMRNCNLSGSSIRDVLNECDKIGVVIRSNMFRLEENDLSDIDGASLAKLVRIIAAYSESHDLRLIRNPSSLPQLFIWSDYCLSAVNLQDLVNSCGEDGRLSWTNLDLSGINLASVNGRTLARLIKISPRLSYLDMTNCNLSGTRLRDVLNECDKIGVVLKSNMLRLKDNDLSDIDGVSLTKLVRMIAVGREHHSKSDGHLSLVSDAASLPEQQPFIWTDYCLSAVNLQDIVNSCGEDGRLSWTNIDLSGINLASVNGRTLARLIKISPRLSYLDLTNCNLSGTSLRDVLNECDNIGVVLKGNMLILRGNDLSDIDGVSLAKLARMIAICREDHSISYKHLSLVGIRASSPEPQAFIWNNYCLSAVNLHDLVHSHGIKSGLTWIHLDLSGINLALVNGKTIALLYKMSPLLSHFDMRNCNLSGSNIKDILNECDKIGVVLRSNMLRLQENDLSDIDGVSFAKLVRIIALCGYDSSKSHGHLSSVRGRASLPNPQPFTWTDYCLSAVNLQDIVNSCGEDIRLSWTNVDLSGINLASVHARTIACLIKISPRLSYLDMTNCHLSGTILRDFLNECDKIGVVLKCNMLRLKDNDLSDIDGVSLAKLVRRIEVCRKVYSKSYKHLRLVRCRASSPELQAFLWNNYCLSAVNLHDLVHSCGVEGGLIWTHLDLSGIKLSSINGRTVACLFKISPQMSYLDMTNCNLSGSNIRDVLNECNKIGVVLKSNMLRLQKNDLSDIDGVSFAKLVRIVALRGYDYPKSHGNLSLIGDRASLPKPQAFIWTDYCLSAVNLQDLVNSVGVGGRLTWTNLDLSGINLALVNGRTLARLIKISPRLSYLDMTNCNLSGACLRDALNECDKIGVVLKSNMLRLKDNDLSDIDGVSLTKLVRLISVCREDHSKYPGYLSSVRDRASLPKPQPFIWTDYCFSAVNLQDIVNSCGENGRLSWTNVDLSGINLASVNGRTLAHLIKISPQLSHLDMGNCNLSGSNIRGVLNECDKIGVVLKGKMLRLEGNDFSNIDDVSLAKILRLSIDVPFTWHKYCLSTANLQDLVSSLGNDNSNIEIDLSSINLSEVTLPLFPSFFSTLGNIYNIIMRDCSLVTSVLHDSMQVLSDRNVKLALVKLDLSNNNLAELGGHSLTSLLCILPNLRQLSMSKCNLKSKVIYEVVTKCKERNIVFKITELDLSCNDFSRLNGATISALFRHTPVLKCLNVSHCSLSGSIMEGLSRLSSDRNGMMRLTDINLSGNNVNVLCKPIVGSGFRDLLSFVPGLKVLDVSKCSLSGSIVQHMCSENKIMMKLTSISIGENDLSDLFWSKIASKFQYRPRPTFTSLGILKINGCQLTNSNLHDIAKYFFKEGLDYILNLTQVDLSNNNLSNVDVPSLTPLIKAVPELKVLNLSNCNIKGKDVTDLINVVLYLDSWSSLRHFDVHKNNFSDIDGSSLASISSFDCLLYLDLSSCHLNDNIFIDMVDSWKFESLHSLLQMNIRDNNLVNKIKVEKKLSEITCQLKTD